MGDGGRSFLMMTCSCFCTGCSMRSLTLNFYIVLYLSTLAMATKTGDLVVVTYEDREFTAIVIDPNGLGEGEPSVGFGFRMASRHIGIPQQTLTNRVTQIEGVEVLKTPSGQTFRVTQIKGVDNNDYKVIEVADWFDLSMDILLNPGKIRKSARENIGAFGVCD